MLFSIPSELYLRNMPSDELDKKTILEKHGNQIRNLIIGNSVIGWGVNPLYLPDSTFNVACTGQCIHSNKLMFDNYYHLTPHVKCIIWGISIQSLWDDNFKPEHIKIENITYEQAVLGFKLDKNFLHHSLLFGFNNYYNTNLHDSLGFDITHQSALSNNIWDHHILNRMEKYQRGKSNELPIYIKNIQTIEDLIKDCNQKGIKVHLVMPPIYKELANLLPDNQLQTINLSMNSLTKKYNNCTWHDYSKDTRFTKEDFIDENHLNADIGAVKFSNILNQNLFSEE